MAACRNCRRAAILVHTGISLCCLACASAGHLSQAEVSSFTGPTLLAAFPFFAFFALCLEFCFALLSEAAAAVLLTLLCTAGLGKTETRSYWLRRRALLLAVLSPT